VEPENDSYEERELPLPDMIFDSSKCTAYDHSKRHDGFHRFERTCL